MTLPDPAPPPLRLRPTMLSDLDDVIRIETDSRNLPFITPWERTQHEAALRIPDFRHFVVEAGDNRASGSRDGCASTARRR